MSHLSRSKRLKSQRLLSLSWRPLTLRLSRRRVGCLGRVMAERAAVLAGPPYMFLFLFFFFFEGKACAGTRLEAQHAMQQVQHGIFQETSLSGGTHSTPTGG